MKNDSFGKYLNYGFVLSALFLFFQCVTPAGGEPTFSDVPAQTIENDDCGRVSISVRQLLWLQIVDTLRNACLKWASSDKDEVALIRAKNATESLRNLIVCFANLPNETVTLSVASRTTKNNKWIIESPSEATLTSGKDFVVVRDKEVSYTLTFVHVAGRARNDLEPARLYSTLELSICVQRNGNVISRESFVPKTIFVVPATGNHKIMMPLFCSHPLTKPNDIP